MNVGDPVTKAKPKSEKAIADSIRDEIAKIPPSELRYAKPSRVLPHLEEAGIEITASVRSATSKLLAKAKERQDKSIDSEIMKFDTSLIESQELNGQELAMRLIEACGGDFELARTEIARLEQFVKKIKGV